MGKADFKKANNNWHGDEANRTTLDKFFDTAAQDQPSTGKKKAKASVKKSNHKHTYEKILIKYENIVGLCEADRCSICGKINLRTVGITEKVGDWYRLLTAEEVLAHPNYKDLPLIDGGRF